MTPAVRIEEVTPPLPAAPVAHVAVLVSLNFPGLDERIGSGLVLAAVAQDGIIEGFEDPGRWLIGVQWHPEDDEGPEADRLRLFGGFVKACTKRHPGRSA